MPDSSGMLFSNLRREGLQSLHDDSSDATGSWGSIIGIVTAIIGNILISLALNTQRYAHIQLSKERDAREEKRKSDKPKHGQGYGTSQQARVAELRAKQNDIAAQNNGKSGSTENSESQPLLSHRDSSPQSSEDSNADSEEQKSYLKSPWWWLGISLMIVGECGNFLAYGFAPASIVSPLGVVALVSNCLIAPLLLHERFRSRDGVGVIIAVAGCVTVVLSAKGSNPKLDADEIWDLITTWEFETYFGITLFLIIILLAVSNKYGEKSILIDLGLVGLLGGYTALSTKGVASLLSNTIWRVVTFPITYLLVFILVSTAIMQIKYVNRALYRFNSTQVIPTQFVLFTLSVIIGSAVLYRDFERRTAADAAKFFGGCALTFLGVWCITSGRSKEANGDEEDSSDEEEGIHLIDEERMLPEIREQDEDDVSRPLPPRAFSSHSDAPMFRFTSHGDESFVSLEGPSPMTENPWETSPAILAAIHTDTAEMPETPTSTKTTRRSKRSPIHATTSEPTVPTLDTRRYPSEILTEPNTPVTPGGGYGRPRTPEDHGLDPASASAPRFGSVNRQSITDMLPQMGPLTNPLSNSLSVIVADSLRRGAEFNRSHSFKRRGLRSRRSTKNVARHSMTEGADYDASSSQPALNRSVSLEPSPVLAPRSQTRSTSRLGAEMPKGRGRSLSATIGDLLRTKKPRRDTEETEDGR